MRKIITIAWREYMAMVATRTFLLSVAIMPIFMFGSLFITRFSDKLAKEDDQRVAVYDATGTVFDKLNMFAEAYNKEADDAKDEEVSNRSRIELVLLEDAELSDKRRLELSDQIRGGEITAFVEVPADMFDDDPAPILFYSTGAFSSARQWFDATVNQMRQIRRLGEAGIDPNQVSKATAPVPVKGMELYSRANDGEIQSGEEKETIVAMLVPFGMMMLMFMIVMLTAQPMLESVLEEKTERIAEVLLGAANPFQIMTGKLLGNVCGSLSIFLIYVIGSYVLVQNQGWEENVPFHALPWFAVFQILAVLFFSSIFMAVGASVRQLKEAQGMMMPVWLTMVTPMFIWVPTLRSPNGTLATACSFFPPATPMMMVLRLSTDAVIPIWQPILALVIMVVSTTLIIFLAGRIFRVAILWQGKTPKLTELLRWATMKA